MAKTTKKVVKKTKRAKDKRRHVGKGQGRKVRYQGKDYTILELARVMNVHQSVVYNRVNKGLSDPEIIKSIQAVKPRLERRPIKPASSAAPLTMEGVAQALVSPNGMNPAGLLKVIKILVNMEMLNDAAFRQAVKELL